MTRIGSSLTIVATVLACWLHAAPAQAQLSRTFVSSFGSDANNCDHPTPCRTFFGAHAKTNAGGEIVVLDPGAYGGLTITKSISIVNDGVGAASMFVSGTNIGIDISAGVNDKIVLRGLTINGLGTGSGNAGIQFNTGRSLTIENCVIRNLALDGIIFTTNASSSLAVSNTLVADNGSGGILVVPAGSGTVKAVFNHVEVVNNGIAGISVDGENSTGTVNATASNSVAANNGGNAFTAQSAAGHALTTLTVVQSVAANNLDGLVAIGTNAILRVAQSTVTGNTDGWQALNGGSVQSYGDNYIDGNTANEAAPPAIAKK
jgi:hypothetical protein